VRRSAGGQAIIEMILVLPLIFIFIMVVVDFGLALDRREVIQHGIREGARAAAVGKNQNEITDVTVNQSQGLFSPGNIDVCYVDKDGNNTAGNAGDSVRVSGTYVYKFVVGSGLLGIGDITMTPSAEARLETSVAGATECP
jgi:Flp pilus assembly protein TadG